MRPFAQGTTHLIGGLALAPDGTVYLGEHLDENGKALLGNFFTGTVATFSLASGEILAKAESGVQRSLAGLAQYPA